jgi:hypothetical protein
MSSPAVSTPSSAGSPAALAPAPPQALAIKSAAFMSSALPTPPIVTRKEWVIPPRPKPGRKPATDTPPTKRKAQNRAAQRAFRERRAARVGELEEQIDELKEEHQRNEIDLRDKIHRLEADVNRYSGELQAWRVRCDTLDRMVEYERSEKDAALVELSYLRNGLRTTGTDAVPLPPRRGHRQEPRPRVVIPEPTPAPPPISEDLGASGCGGCSSGSSCACAEHAMTIVTSSCGNCTSSSHCQCLEDTITQINETPSDSGMKRPHSPAEDPQDHKRLRPATDHSSPIEIDFTAQFSTKAQPLPPRPSHENIIVSLNNRPPLESCGFCEDGTYCVCAEAAASNSNNADADNRLAPILNEVTPPPSDTDVTISDSNLYKLPSLQPIHMHRPLSQAPAPSANSCANGPGTCQQCLSDPKSGLFCRSLAAMRAAGTAPPDGGCCGGGGGAGGCCKTQSQPKQNQPPPSLNCADAYKTLSTHKNFDQASDELNTWLGRLNATPAHHNGRPAMEVEAASVMGVLKLFDRRFGRG